MIEAANSLCIVHIEIEPMYPLRLSDGRRVFMEWHEYCGPTFYRDRRCTRWIDDWWKDARICRALDWFVKRGKIA